MARRDFEADYNDSRTVKTEEEKTEEDIVMDYVRKQSLLEALHRSKRQSNGEAIEDVDDVG